MTFEEITEQGTKLFGVKWLEANEAAIHAASRLQVQYYNPYEKRLISAVVLAVLKTMSPKKQLTEAERNKGRSENYYSMSSEDQWAEDKRLGILDWDGK